MQIRNAGPRQLKIISNSNASHKLMTKHLCRQKRVYSTLTASDIREAEIRRATDAGNGGTSATRPQTASEKMCDVGYSNFIVSSTVLLLLTGCLLLPDLLGRCAGFSSGNIVRCV